MMNFKTTKVSELDASKCVEAMEKVKILLQLLGVRYKEGNDDRVYQNAYNSIENAIQLYERDGNAYEFLQKLGNFKNKYKELTKLLRDLLENLKEAKKASKVATDTFLNGCEAA